MARREGPGKQADAGPHGLSPRIDAAVSHFVRNPPGHLRGSASSRPPRPPPRDRRHDRPDDRAGSTSRRE